MTVPPIPGGLQGSRGLGHLPRWCQAASDAASLVMTSVVPQFPRCCRDTAIPASSP